MASILSALDATTQHRLYSSHELTKSIFAAVDPNVVIGATELGYIVLWDIRAGPYTIGKSSL